jgi:hypothetical protein
MNPESVLFPSATLAPQLVQDPVGGHDLVGVKQHQRQQGPLLVATQIDRLPGPLEFERTEDPELHIATEHARAPIRADSNIGCLAT